MFDEYDEDKPLVEGLASPLPFPHLMNIDHQSPTFLFEIVSNLLRL
jgi:hypothetical protein